MILVQRRRHKVHGRVTWALVLFVLGMGATTSTAQSMKIPLPSVVGARVPFYPRIPQQAHIEGTVRLRVSTDGRRSSSIEVESGPPMLARAAKENVETWQFEQHSPTTFEVTFRYKILPSECDAKCDCDSLEKPAVLLRLPTEVEVSAKQMMVCDPAEEIKH